MAILKIGKYSNGIEEFNVEIIKDKKAYLSTRSGVKFLKAKRNINIEIGKDSLESFLDTELKGFLHQE
jgi:hypothetical protein